MVILVAVIGLFLLMLVGGDGQAHAGVDLECVWGQRIIEKSPLSIDLSSLISVPDKRGVSMPFGKRRSRRQEERQTFGRGGSANRYIMRQRMIAIGDDYWIEDAQGERAFEVDGKALRIRDTLLLKDRQGEVLCKIQERMLRIKDSMEVKGPHGERLAIVKKALISPLRDRFTVKIMGGPDLDVKGNILDHEYTIGAGRDTVAEVSKKWFRIRDSYGVQVHPDQDDAIILAIAICIDQMVHD